jgi:hypothetical protein
MSFSAVREAFRSLYPDKEASSKTTVHRLVAKFRVDACRLQDGGHLL